MTWSSRAAVHVLVSGCLPVLLTADGNKKSLPNARRSKGHATLTTTAWRKLMDDMLHIRISSRL